MCTAKMQSEANSVWSNCLHVVNIGVMSPPSDVAIGADDIGDLWVYYTTSV